MIVSIQKSHKKTRQYQYQKRVKRKYFRLILLPACAECFVWRADRQSEWFPLSKNLAGDEEVRAVLLVQTWKAQHRVLQQSFVALLLSLPFKTTSIGGKKILRCSNEPLLDSRIESLIVKLTIGGVSKNVWSFSLKYLRFVDFAFLVFSFLTRNEIHKYTCILSYYPPQHALQLLSQMPNPSQKV